MSFWVNLAAAAAGGAVGAAGRYALSVWAKAALGPAFPWGTLIANIAGGFAMGALAAALLGRAAVSTPGADPGLWPALLLAGLLGGFTTFSAFSLETILLIETGRPAAAAVYVFGSVTLCVGAAALGLALARAYWLGS